MSFATTIPLLLGLVIWAGILALVIYLAVLLIKALRKYLKSGPVRQEKAEMARSLGEAIRYHRTRCKMTQEFVAESLGVSPPSPLCARTASATGMFCPGPRRTA